MINSGASLNFIPVSVCKNLNLTWETFPTQIVQLNRSRVEVLMELKNILLTFSMDHIIHQTMDIVVADVLETHGRWLSRD